MPVIQDTKCIPNWQHESIGITVTRNTKYYDITKFPVEYRLFYQSEYNMYIQWKARWHKNYENDKRAMTALERSQETLGPLYE